MNQLKALIGIPEEKEDFVVEIYDDTYIFGEIERKNGRLILEVFNYPNKENWQIDVNELYKIIRKSIVELGEGSEEIEKSNDVNYKEEIR